MKNELRRIDQLNPQALRADLARVDTLARDFCRERPLMAVAAALGLGYSFGRVVARR
jgi:hypothetical protein